MSCQPKATYQSPASSSYFVSKISIFLDSVLYFFKIPDIANDMASFSVFNRLSIKPIPGLIEYFANYL
ncbi:uncharacterized protein METZ01_LOCUS69233 [marine metagenome]|uniref:Uncharacterized protein n=1 Tax=marine metagenome TaxID=408172 RepID=A0A381TKN7_9ZZZZ